MIDRFCQEIKVGDILLHPKYNLIDLVIHISDRTIYSFYIRCSDSNGTLKEKFNNINDPGHTLKLSQISQSHRYILINEKMLRNSLYLDKIKFVKELIGQKS